MLTAWQKQQLWTTVTTLLQLMQVYIVDFGLAVTAPNRQRALQNSMYMYANFQGTPDYASKDALNGCRCSAKVSTNAVNANHRHSWFSMH